MNKIIIVLALLLCSCGSNQVTITYHEVDDETLASICDTCEGFAEWNNLIGECDIYLWPREDYLSLRHYHEVLGHETDHCFTGDFHN